MSKLLQEGVKGLCDCGYILPYAEPESHGINCTWRRFIALTNDDMATPTTVKILITTFEAICFSQENHEAVKQFVKQFKQEIYQS